MMKSNYVLILWIVCFFMGTFFCLSYGQEQSITPEPEVKERVGLEKLREQLSTISVLGRLTQDTQLSKEALFLTSKDAKTYIIKGELVDKLKQILLDLGENNVVSLTGLQDGRHEIICRNTYSFDKKHRAVAESRCIRCYHLTVRQIIETKTSNEEFPALERDRAEEDRVKKMALSGPSPITPSGLIQTVSRDVIITNVNLKSVIKTIGIKFMDKDGQFHEEILLVSPQTQFLKLQKTGDKTSLPVSINALQPNQKVSVVYAIDYSQAPQRSTAVAIGIKDNN